MSAVLTRPGLGERLLEEAARLVAARRPAGAWPLLRSAAEDLALPAAWPPLAEVLLLLDLPEAVIAACDTGLAGGGHDRAALLVSRARAHGRLGRIDRALSDAAGAVAAAPRDETARTVLGQALLANGRHEEALAVLGEIWREMPEDAPRALRLVDALLAAKAHDAVEEMTGWLLTLDLAPLHRQQATALGAQNTLARGSPAEALMRAQAAVAAYGAVGEAQWAAALHSIAAHALIALQRNDEAQPHLAAAHRLMPGDQYLAHLAATSASGHTLAPDRASDNYVRHLFDGYAAGFGAALLGLGYRAPGLILGLLEELRPSGMFGEVLDLGCGTGLMGVVLHDRLGAGLRGIDLSGAMLDEARAKGVYTALARADIDGWLAQDGARYELVIAADVFCYFGALEGTLAAIAPRLAPDGLLLFTVEAGASAAWELLPSGRYRHSEGGLRAALQAAGLTLVALRGEVLRQERGQPLEGFLVAARR
ncbi:MAG: methyltransferase domain-containing protein [Rubritepida sp.]|nr:methyltransferase domain-containing protein [Rubritepida sp.]